MNIYVGNLDFKVNEEELKGIFDEYGIVSDVKIITDKYNGRSKGFGFVVMENSNEGENAIKELNGATIKNRQIVVNEAREKKDSEYKRKY